MMSHDFWLNELLGQVRTIASREYQEQNWFRTDMKVGVNWVVEAYNVLFDDLTFDLFFGIYSKNFTPQQMTAWLELKSSLDSYDETQPQYPDERKVFEDPEWQRVREAAGRFVTVFERNQS